MTTNKWTIVQHSGYGYKRNPQFQHAVEVRKTESAAEERRVEKAGGILFDTYMEAENFAERANYPVGHVGIIPDARGTFSVWVIDDLHIYIPVRPEAVG
jgi:hypothetical protein